MSPRSITLFQPNARRISATLPFGARVVAAHEDIVVAAPDSRRVDHDLTVDGVERLDHLRLRKRALNLLAERIGVSREQAWAAFLWKIERVGGVDEDFAPEVALTSRLERRRARLRPMCS